MAGRPIRLCRGGYFVLADEAGNKATAGLLALGRLSMAYRVADHGCEWLAVLDALRCLESLHKRLECCDNDCEACEARASFERIGTEAP